MATINFWAARMGCNYAPDPCDSTPNTAVIGVCDGWNPNGSSATASTTQVGVTTYVNGQLRFVAQNGTAPAPTPTRTFAPCNA